MSRGILKIKKLETGTNSICVIVVYGVVYITHGICYPIMCCFVVTHSIIDRSH